jgi:hypothetical protein
VTLTDLSNLFRTVGLLTLKDSYIISLSILSILSVPDDFKTTVEDRIVTNMYFKTTVEHHIVTNMYFKTTVEDHIVTNLYFKTTVEDPNLFRTVGLLTLKDSYIISLSILSILSVPDERYSERT